MTHKKQPSSHSIARTAGYYIREGSYRGTTDDRLGQWYVGIDGKPFRPWGQGYRTQRAAWEAAAAMSTERGDG